MQAAGATILTFPGRGRPTPPLPELELGREQQLAGRWRASISCRPDDLGTPGWLPNLLLAVPLFLSPQAGSASDVAAVLLAVLAFSLTGRPAALLAREPGRWRESLPALAAAGLGALALGPAILAGLLLLGLLAAAGQQRRLHPWLGTAATILGAPLRLDLGAAVLGLTLPGTLLAAGLLLGLLLALLNERAPEDAPRTLWRELPLLAAALGTTALHAAALAADPWVERASGSWALAAVPLLLLALLRLWQLARARPRPSPAGAADPVLVALLAGWALVLTLTLPPPVSL